MKRYHLFFDGNTDGAFWRDVEEDPDGEWVKAGEALAEIARLQALVEVCRVPVVFAMTKGLDNCPVCFVNCWDGPHKPGCALKDAYDALRELEKP